MPFIGDTIESDLRGLLDHGRDIEGPGLILPNVANRDRIAEALS